MIELEALTRSINGLTELLRVARRDLANPVLPPLERREAHQQIDLCGFELRRHLLLIEAERSRVRKESSAQDGGRNFPHALDRNAEPRRAPLGV
jgi:hypothetical protein